MFSPFVTSNFSLHLQNQIKTHFQHQHAQNQLQETEYTSSQRCQTDPFQNQNLQNLPQNYSSTHLNSNHENESYEYMRKPTFFGDILLGSNTIIDPFIKKVENNFKNSPNFNENPQNVNSHKKYQREILTLSNFDLPQHLGTESIAKKQTAQTQINQNQLSIETLHENEKQEITETEQLFQMFDKQELQSKKKQTNHFPSTIQQKSEEESFDKIYEESFVEELNTMQLPQVYEAPKKSFLKQMSSKIKNCRIHCQRTDSNKFSLKQFNQTIKRAKEVPSAQKGHLSQNQQLYQAILDLVRKREVIDRQQPQEMEHLVQKLKQSILPHFQKLQNDYSQKITQMNELIQAMITMGLTRPVLTEKEDIKPKKEQKRLYHVTQSVIRINLNDEEGSEHHKSHSRSKEYPLEQIEEEIQKKYKEQIIEVPVITRTDSSEGFFPQNRSCSSQVDILASINSKEDPLKGNDDI